VADEQITVGSVRLGATAVGLGALALAVIQILQSAVGAFEPRPAVAMMCALSVGLIGLTVERGRYLVAQARARAAALRVWPLPAVIAADPLALGVFPSQLPSVNAPLGPYVPRDADPELVKALSDGGLTVVVGPEGAGKSRSVYEAARQVLPARTVLIPLDGAALGVILGDRAFSGDELVWWLDDLERFLPYLDGRALTSLIEGPRTVVATMREAAWTTLSNASGGSGEQARRVVAAAHLIRIPAIPSAAESAAASRCYPGIDCRLGIGRALAGPPVKSDTKNSRAPSVTQVQRAHDAVFTTAAAASVGAVLVLGALVMSRGFSRPIQPAVGAQIDEIRELAAKRGSSTRFTLRGVQLHPGGRSHMFVLSPENHGSDELRIYDEVEGQLRLRFSFRPSTRGHRGTLRAPPSDQQTAGTLDYWTSQRPIVADIDGDGTREILVSYSMRADFDEFGATVRLPLIFGWDDTSRGYRVSALLSARTALRPGCSALGRAVYARGPYVLRDGRPDRQQRVTACAVSSATVLRLSQQSHTPRVIATATDATRNGDVKKTRTLAVTPYLVTMSKGRPSVRACTASGLPFRINVPHERGSDYERVLQRIGPNLVQWAGGPDSQRSPCIRK
jgi:hypothetical protein